MPPLKQTGGPLSLSLSLSNSTVTPSPQHCNTLQEQRNKNHLIAFHLCIKPTSRVKLVPHPPLTFPHLKRIHGSWLLMARCAQSGPSDPTGSIPSFLHQYQFNRIPVKWTRRNEALSFYYPLKQKLALNKLPPSSNLPNSSPHHNLSPSLHSSAASS